MRTKRDYDLKAHEFSFKKGDIVLILNKGVKKGQSSKLTMPWKDPGIILQVMSPCTYKVQVGSWDFKICHHDSLKVIREEDKQLPKWLVKVRNSMSSGKSVTYCYCNQPDDGTEYIECSGCKNWFHLLCAGVKDTKKKFSCRDCN